MVKVLFVCLGNICRSPSAEGVMKKIVEQENMENDIYVDSAGTGAWHVGEPADGRMKRHAIKRGYNLTSVARQFEKEDFEKFDYIVAMDKQNFRDIISKDPATKYRSKVSMMTDYCRTTNVDEVPDPYYGGPQGFERVLDILEDACQGLLEKIKQEHF